LHGIRQLVGGVGQDVAGSTASGRRGGGACDGDSGGSLGSGMRVNAKDEVKGINAGAGGRWSRAGRSDAPGVVHHVVKMEDSGVVKSEQVASLSRQVYAKDKTSGQEKQKRFSCTREETADEEILVEKGTKAKKQADNSKQGGATEVGGGRGGKQKNKRSWQSCQSSAYTFSKHDVGTSLEIECVDDGFLSVVLVKYRKQQVFRIRTHTHTYTHPT